MAADGSPYFWAGGRLSSDKRTLSWENGRSEGIRKGQVKLLLSYTYDDDEDDYGDDDVDDVVQHPWSFTGSRGAQPDGGRGSENCLAILNNFYNVSGSKSFIKEIEVNVRGGGASQGLLCFCLFQTHYWVPKHVRKFHILFMIYTLCNVILHRQIVMYAIWSISKN